LSSLTTVSQRVISIKGYFHSNGETLNNPTIINMHLLENS